MSQVAYAVMENGWEYNDEYYSRPDCGGGKPLVVYPSQQEANQECGRLEREAFRNGTAQGRIYLGAMSSDAINEFWEVLCEVTGESLDLQALDKEADTLDAVSKQLWEDNKSKDDQFRRTLAQKLFPEKVYKDVTGYSAQHEAWEDADLKALDDDQLDRLIGALPEWKRFYEVMPTRLA